MFTKHGHQIPNTPVDPQRPKMVARCGGPGLCKQCSSEILHGLMDQKEEKHEVYPVDDQHMRPAERARLLVAQYINARIGEDDQIEPLRLSDIYEVWFCKTLQNWKGLFTTNIPDGFFFEVTYNGDKGETYLDAYVKWQNVVIPDGGIH